MPHIVLSDGVFRDLERLHAYRKQFGERGADQAMGAIRAQFPLLAAQPGIGRKLSRHSELREWKVRSGHGAYRILYRCDGDEVIITAVKHSKESRESE